MKPASGRTERLKEALAELSALERDVLFALMRGEDESAGETIARRHGLPPAALRLERFRALKRLGEALAQFPAG
jgi:DNA-directed RNA polymerase specialized sigma24 family protein